MGRAAQLDIDGQVKAAEVLAQLELIVRGAFRYGEPTREQLILRHLVKEKLAGRRSNQQSLLKFLDLPPLPKNKARVRVLMSRIRKRLRVYYQDEGYGAAMVIEFAIRRYSPNISKRREEDQLSYREINLLRKAQAASDLQTLPATEDALQYLEQLRDPFSVWPKVLSLKADIHVIRAIHGMRPEPELAKAETYVKRALALAPTFSQAHVIQGFLYSTYGNKNEARIAFGRATMYALRHVPVHFWHTAYLLSRGKLPEALRLNELAAGMVPGYYDLYTQPRSVVLADLGLLQVMDDDLARAADTLQQADREAPREFHAPKIYLSLLREAQDDSRGAAKAIEDLSRLPPEESGMATGIVAMVNGLAGDTAVARSVLDFLVEAKKQGNYVPASQFMLAHLGAGNHHEALGSILHMSKDRDPLIHWLGYLPFLRHIAYLKDFGRVLQRIGLKWYWRRRRN